MTAGAQPKMHELLAIDTDAGTRLDRFVAAHCAELSRARVQELIDGGLVLVNGKPAKASQKLRSGLDDKAGHAPDSSFIGVTILFKEKTPAGKQVFFNISPPDLLVLLKYLHVGSSSAHAL